MARDVCFLTVDEPFRTLHTLHAQAFAFDLALDFSFFFSPSLSSSKLEAMRQGLMLLHKFARCNTCRKTSARPTSSSSPLSSYGAKRKHWFWCKSASKSETQSWEMKSRIVIMFALKKLSKLSDCQVKLCHKKLYLGRPSATHRTPHTSIAQGQAFFPFSSILFLRSSSCHKSMPAPPMIKAFMP